MTAPAVAAEPLHVETRPAHLSLPCSRCGALPARRYMNAWLCPVHAPIVPTPDPARTAAGLSSSAWWRA